MVQYIGGALYVQTNLDVQQQLFSLVQISDQSKQEAATNVFKPAAQIVNDAMVSHSNHTAPAGSRPNVHNLQTSTNRLREKSRPKDPTDLNFEINYDFLPENFFKKDVVVDSNRHLIFATDSQLDVLSSAKVWYMDATFKIISKPFYQMFSIHPFIRTGEDNSQLCHRKDFEVEAKEKKNMKQV
ncbi:unnamed protein product [Mytilus edulis]|uniref:Uncharacterized protein n=1 Tax=Mytilus edulis TaxID=6550 RepID=A0A8S3SIL6_MYTED|nr:unnamed protein product [Mytilus edulis]